MHLKMVNTRTSLAVQWLTARPRLGMQVRSLVRELRAHIPCSMATKKKKEQTGENGQLMLCLFTTTKQLCKIQISVFVNSSSIGTRPHAVTSGSFMVLFAMTEPLKSGTRDHVAHKT